MSRYNIAFVLTGSVAAYKACDVVSRLVQRGHAVRAVVTASARHFVGESTLEGLTGRRVLSDMFEPGAALEHIEITRWADLVIVCPATANTLNRYAAGLADDLSGALFLAHDRSKPFLMAPAMNPEMWSHPATQEAVSKLVRWGVGFVPVEEGRTACGEVGPGRLADPSRIVAAIEAALARPTRRLRVLVTSGGTSEPIDGVRAITNSSTGRTGSDIAEHLARTGHEVFFLRARGALPSPSAFREETFFTFSELEAGLSRILGEVSFDAVVHCAAVSDFGVSEVEVDGIGRPPGVLKIESNSAPVLRLRANPKLVDRLKSWSLNPNLRVVAFKLTRGANEDDAQGAVRHLFAHSNADLVVHNDLSERKGPEAFPSTVHFPDARPPLGCSTRSGLAAELERLLTTLVSPGRETSASSPCSSA